MAPDTSEEFLKRISGEILERFREAAANGNRSEVESVAEVLRAVAMEIVLPCYQYPEWVLANKITVEIQTVADYIESHPNPRETANLKSVDLMGEKCAKCGQGFYTETSIHDDWEGLLHCSSCGHEVSRHALVEVQE